MIVTWAHARTDAVAVLVHTGVARAAPPTHVGSPRRLAWTPAQQPAQWTGAALSPDGTAVAVATDDGRCGVVCPCAHPWILFGLAIEHVPVRTWPAGRPPTRVSLFGLGTGPASEGRTLRAQLASLPPVVAPEAPPPLPVDDPQTLAPHVTVDLRVIYDCAFARAPPWGPLARQPRPTA